MLSTQAADATSYGGVKGWGAMEPGCCAGTAVLDNMLVMQARVARRRLTTFLGSRRQRAGPLSGDAAFSPRVPSSSDQEEQIYRAAACLRVASWHATARYADGCVYRRLSRRPCSLRVSCSFLAGKISNRNFV